MKSIKVLSIAMMILNLSGCMKYQYSTIDSNLNRNAKNEFLKENDSIQVIYNFNGHNGPIGISVKNKLDKPLFVNWKRSSIIMDGKSDTYWRDQSALTASSSGYELNWLNGITTSRGTISGTLSRPDEISFIAPNSYIKSSLLNLKSDFFKINKSVKPMQTDINSTTGSKSGYIYYFDDYNSLLKYRSYLTFSYDADFSRPFIFQDEFWVGEVMKTTLSPKNIPEKSRNADTFYTSKATGAGTFLALVVLIALIGLQPNVKH